MSGQGPPRPWAIPSECPREGCDVERYTPLGMEFHLALDHDRLPVGRKV